MSDLQTLALLKVLFIVVGLLTIFLGLLVIKVKNQKDASGEVKVSVLGNSIYIQNGTVSMILILIGGAILITTICRGVELKTEKRGESKNEISRLKDDDIGIAQNNFDKNKIQIKESNDLTLFSKNELNIDCDSLFNDAIKKIASNENLGALRNLYLIKGSYNRIVSKKINLHDVEKLIIKIENNFKNDEYKKYEDIRDIKIKDENNDSIR